MCVCVRARMHACVRACVCVCVCMRYDSLNAQQQVYTFGLESDVLRRAENRRRAEEAERRSQEQRAQAEAASRPVPMSTIMPSGILEPERPGTSRTLSQENDRRVCRLACACVCIVWRVFVHAGLTCVWWWWGGGGGGGRCFMADLYFILRTGKSSRDVTNKVSSSQLFSRCAAFPVREMKCESGLSVLW